MLNTNNSASYNRFFSRLLVLAFMLLCMATQTKGQTQFPYDVSQAAFTGNDFFIGNEDGTPTSLRFNADGTRMFMIGSSTDYIYEYDLSAAYEVSTATYNGDAERFSVASQETSPADISFTPDGLTMFVMGTSGDDINQYTLTTSFDVSTAVYDGDGERFSVNSQETFPRSLNFNSDGLKMFVLGASGDDINQYTLSSPYDVSTAVYDGDGERFSTGSQESDPHSMTFSADGLKMFVLGSAGDDINQYTLSVPYDISTAVYDGNAERLNISAQETTPRLVQFNNDGTMLYVMGSDRDAVFEYTLMNIAPAITGTIAGQTIHDLIASINPFSSTLILDSNGSDDLSATITLSNNADGTLSGVGVTGTGPYSIASTTPAALRSAIQALTFTPTVNSTATTTFTIEVNDGELSFSDNNTTVTAISNPSVNSIVVSGNPDPKSGTADFIVTFNEDVTGVDQGDFILNTSSASVTGNISALSGSGSSYTVTISNIIGDGLVSVDLLSSGTGIVDLAANNVTGGFVGPAHIVGLAFDVSEAALSGNSFSISQDGRPTSIAFNSDGSRMFVLGSLSNRFVHEYDLSTAFDISTVSYNGDAERFSVIAQDNVPFSLSFTPDGSSMFVMGFSGRNINQYTLSTPYDVSTAAYDGDNERFNVISQELLPQSLSFNPDGSKMFVMGNDGDDINQYTLSIPYDVSTAVYDGNGERFSVTSQESNPVSMTFSVGGFKMFVMGGSHIYQYSLSAPYDVSTAVYDGDAQRLEIGGLGGQLTSLIFSNDGTRLFVVEQLTDRVVEYVLINVAPEITQTIAGQTVNSLGSTNPFSSVMISDSNGSDNLSATISLSNNADGTLSGTGVTGTGPYTIASTSPTALQSTIQALTFTPTVNSTATTTFTLDVSDGALTDTDSNTTVTAISYPSVSSIVVSGNPGPQATTVDFIVSFDEDVTGVDQGDFLLNTTASVTGSISAFSGSGATYTITVNGLTGSGYVSVDLLPSGTGIIDVAANNIVGGFIGNFHLIGLAYDVSEADFIGNDFFVRNQEALPTSVRFNADGTRMYVLGRTSDSVNEYDLSTAFDISTATYNGNTERFSVSGQESDPADLVFTPDGLTMFVMGTSGDDINQYTLTAAFDVSTATYDGDAERFNISSQEMVPSSLSFNSDGSKMFVLGAFEGIGQYTLSTPYDISTAVYDGDGERFSVSSQESLAQSMAFSPGGLKMFVIGTSGDDVNQYTLSAPYDVSTAVYDGDVERLQVAAQENAPQAMVFSNDGTRLFVAGATNDSVIEYILFNVAPEIAQTVAGQTVNSLGSINPFASIMVSDGNTSDNLSATITLSDNADGILSGAGITGTGPYSIASTPQTTLQTTLQSLTFTPANNSTATTTFTMVVSDGEFSDTDNNTTVTAISNPLVSSIAVSGNPDPRATTVDFIVTLTEDVIGVDQGDFVLNTSTSITGNISAFSGSGDTYTVTVSNIMGVGGFISIDLLPSGTGITDLAANNILGGFVGDFHLVRLAYDVSEAAFIGNDFPFGTQDGTPISLRFNGDGTRMFMMGSSTDHIYEYDLSVAFDVSTATYNGNAERFSVASQETSPTDLSFTPDGLKMFVIGTAGDDINQYTLSSAFDISTAMYDGDSERFNISSQESSPSSLNFNSDGSKMFVLGASGDDINQYSLSTPYDVSTAIYDGDSESFSVSSQESNPLSMTFSAGGLKMFVSGTVGDDVGQYTLSAPYDISTAVYDGDAERLQISAQETTPRLILFNNDGTKLFAMGSDEDAVFEYELINLAPTVLNPIVNQQTNEDEAFSFVIPLTTFEDPNAGDLLSLSALLDGGGALPGWLSFDNATNTLSGTPTNFDVGTIAIMVTAKDQDGLSVSTTFSLEVINTFDPPLTITVDPQSKVYGDGDPTFTYQITNGTLMPGDMITGNLSRVAGEDAGTYAIEIGDLSPGIDYDVTFVSNDLTIQPKPITITADAGQGKTYGQADPALNYTVTSGSLEAGDIVTGDLDRIIGENVGLYTIQEGTLTAGANYSVTYVPDNFLILAKPIMVTVDFAQTKVYGQPDPVFTYTLTGFLEPGDSFTGVLDRVIGEDVGNYSIGQGTLDAGSNYNLSFTSDDFAITPKPITITTDAGQTKAYGQIDPTFNYTITSGSLELGDTFIGNLDRAPGEDVGNYAIGQGTLDAGGNYSMTFIPDDFSVNPKPITVTADAGQMKTYGDIDPIFGFSTLAGALEAGDSFTGALSRVAGEFVGNYALEIGTLGAGSNYTISFVPNNFFIDPKPITVEADLNHNKVYGEVDPTFTFSLTTGSLEVGDSFAGSLVRITGEDVGFYTIDQGTLSAGGNYTMTYVSSDFEITQKALDVSPNSGQGKTYGDTDPVLTYMLLGSLEAGDVITGSLGRVVGEDVGTYAIGLGSLDAGPNYLLSVSSEVFTIDPAALIATADDQIRMYNQPNPPLTISYSGFVNGDTPASISEPFISTSAIVTSNVGAYPIILINGIGGSPSNYTINAVDGTLTIVKANQLISFSALNDVSDGGPDFNLNATSSSGLTVTYASSDPLVATISGSTVTVVGVGTTNITASQVGDANHDPAPDVIQSLTVNNKLPQTITFDPLANETYGNLDFNLSATGGGSSNPVTFVSSDPSVATISGNTVTVLNTGTTEITAAQAGGGTYNAASDVTQTLVVDPRAITVTADAKSKIFGETDPSLTYQITSGTLIGSDSFSGSLVRVVGENAGTYSIMQGSLVLNTNYDLGFTENDFEIEKATIDVSVEDASRVYNTTNPTFNLSYGGFISGDTEAALDELPTASTTAIVSSDAGSYPITISGGVDNNYTFSYIVGTLTITKAAATITLSNLEQEENGSMREPTIVTDPAGLNFVIAWVDGSAPTEPGDYNFTVSIDETNYEGEEEGTLTLLKVLGFDQIPILIYPNPADEYLIVESQEDLKVEIMDLRGSQLIQSDSKKPIDIREIPSGTFLLRLTNEYGESRTTRFIRKAN